MGVRRDAPLGAQFKGDSEPGDVQLNLEKPVKEGASLEGDVEEERGPMTKPPLGSWAKPRR